jgi:hypothetical protein
MPSLRTMVRPQQAYQLVELDAENLLLAIMQEDSSAS